LLTAWFASLRPAREHNRRKLAEMLKSTKIALASLGTWGLLNVVKNRYAPEIDPMDETSIVVMSGPLYTLWTMTQFLANMLIFVGLTALLIALLTKLKLLPRQY
jgi:hypothetical protein